MHDYSLFLREFRVSGNFPETTWWAIHSLQATHDNSGVFWVPEMEPLGDTRLPARQRLLFNPIMGFSDEGYGGSN